MKETVGHSEEVVVGASEAEFRSAITSPVVDTARYKTLIGIRVNDMEKAMETTTRNTKEVCYMHFSLLSYVLIFLFIIISLYLHHLQLQIFVSVSFTTKNLYIYKIKRSTSTSQLDTV